ncbi:ankyrin repeat domain-containing protein [Candidatus Woesearchaeota archaeon]|nr:ankyrin repeat domain-containing protein [Candidatus Woesearchaeota archaeon]
MGKEQKNLTVEVKPEKGDYFTVKVMEEELGREGLKLLTLRLPILQSREKYTDYMLNKMEVFDTRIIKVIKQDKYRKSLKLHLGANPDDYFAELLLARIYYMLGRYQDCDFSTDRLLSGEVWNKLSNSQKAITLRIRGDASRKQGYLNSAFQRYTNYLKLKETPNDQQDEEIIAFIGRIRNLENGISKLTDNLKTARSLIAAEGGDELKTLINGFKQKGVLGNLLDFRNRLSNSIRAHKKTIDEKELPEIEEKLKSAQNEIQIILDKAKEISAKNEKEKADETPQKQPEGESPKAPPDAKGDTEKREIDSAEEKADLNTKLSEAVRWNRDQEVEELLSQGADPNILLDGESCLHYAARWKMPLTVEKLLSAKGINVDAVTEKYQITPLITAAIGGYADIVGKLLEAGANPAAIDEKNNLTAIEWAIYIGRTNVVEKLLEKGVDQKSIGQSGEAYLVQAVEYGKPEIVKILLGKGVDPNIANRYQKPCIVNAAGLGFLEVVKILLENGADPLAKDKYGKTAIDRANESGHEDIAKLIQAHIDKKEGKK